MYCLNKFLEPTAWTRTLENLVAPWHVTSQGAWLVAKQSPVSSSGGKKVISKNKIKYYFIFLFPSTFSVHPVLLCCREQQQHGKSEQQFGSIFRETLLPQTKIYIELNGVSATYFSLLSGNCKKKRNS